MLTGSPQKGALKRSVLNLNNNLRYKIGCPLLLVINKKSHTVFRLVSISVTLNDLERRNSTYFALFHFACLLRHSG